MRSKLPLLAVGLACALLACDVILDLGKFKKCNVDVTCATDAGDALDASDAGNASDAFVLPDGASEASSWARWRMDNTPIEVQGGAPDASLTAFTPSAPYLVDLVNDNAWCVQSIGKAANVTDAASFCAKMDCRLPTRIELVTLLDSTQQQSKIFITPQIQPFVADAGAMTLWSSSYVRPISETGIQFWFAELSTGDMIQSPAANVGVLCIH